MKKQVAVFCLFVFCCLSLVACGSFKELRLLNEFGVTLPKGMALKNMTRIYDANNQGWMGDGDHYAAFKLKQAPSEIPAGFIKSDNSMACQGQIRRRTESGIKGLGVPCEYQPNWDKEYYWKFVGKDLLFLADENTPFDRYDDELFLIYQPHDLRLFLYANFV